MDSSAKHLQERFEAGVFAEEELALCLQLSKLLGDLGIKDRNMQAVKVLKQGLLYRHQGS